MSYKFNDSESSIQFSCRYGGHPLEAVAMFTGLFFLLLWFVIVSYLFLFLPRASEINWGGFVEYGLFLSALLFYFGIECLWQAVGKEVIVLSENGVILRHQIFGIGLSRRYDIDKTNGVFLTQARDTDVALRIFFRVRSYGFFYFRHGKLAFNCGKTWFFKKSNTYRFGTGLTWDEAKQIVAKIHQRFPKYRYD